MTVTAGRFDANDADFAKFGVVMPASNGVSGCRYIVPGVWGITSVNLISMARSTRKW
jgi:hypothetical protein